jgi:protein-S-isoprenylcysteine O-methyltransferase Ste14
VEFIRKLQLAIINNIKYLLIIMLLLCSNSILRHPSYFGWFYWSIGTQIILCNPICVVFYSYATWKFFAGRIPYEESLLEKFYPVSYKVCKF